MTILSTMPPSSLALVQSNNDMNLTWYTWFRQFAGASPNYPIPVSQGGTGATTVAAAKINLDIGAPHNVKYYGAKGDGITDDTAAFNSALSSISSAGGGVLYIPSGAYAISSSLIIPKNTTIKGEGISVTQISYSGITDCLKSTWPINSSTAVNITVQDLQITCTNAASTGAGFADVGGTFVRLERVLISNFKYGIIFDQTEISSIKDCILQFNTTNNLWIANGATHTAGASSEFTNNITVMGTQFNTSSAIVHVKDDGGTQHSYICNNFNGGNTAIRMQDTSGATIMGNEIELNGLDYALYFTDDGTTPLNNCRAIDVFCNAMSSSNYYLVCCNNIANSSFHHNEMDYWPADRLHTMFNFPDNPNLSNAVEIYGNWSNPVAGGDWITATANCKLQNNFNQLPMGFSPTTVAAPGAATVVMYPYSSDKFAIGAKLFCVNRAGTNSEIVTITALNPGAFTITANFASTKNGVGGWLWWLLPSPGIAVPGASGTILISNGSSWIASTSIWPNTVGTNGKVVISDGTNNVYSTPTFPNASATSGKFIRSDGTNWIASTPTLPTTAGTANTHLRSDGTNFINTTSTYPDTVSQGDVIYASASNTVSSLAKNASATRYLSNTGASNNPAWAQVDVTNGITGTVPLASGGTNKSSAYTGNQLVVVASGAYSEIAAGSSGNLLQSNGAGVNPSWVATTTIPGKFIKFTLFSTPGTATWTPDTNCNTVQVICIGGGGGGGGAKAAASNIAIGSGGGGGGMCLKIVAKATFGASQTITVGSAGTAGANTGGNGGNGGTSSFGTICTATGGVAGRGNATGGTSVATGPLAGDGGGGTLGDINLTGDSGTTGIRCSGTDGVAGRGGCAAWGGGGAQGLNAGNTGNTGPQYGGGGSGACSNSTTGLAGGQGGTGAVLIWEYT